MRKTIEAKKEKLQEKLAKLNLGHLTRVKPLEDEIDQCDALLAVVDRMEKRDA